MTMHGSITARCVLGCIADDLTGATDLANNLARAGMRVVLAVDVPADNSQWDADAIVIALQSRTVPALEAVAQSLAACRWLRRRGVRQIYFKICSTFDSTPQGNIGPVLEALMQELDCMFSTVVPSFPDAGRTVYQGHLFVGSVPVSESSMRHHPLTPMTDANLVRFLQLQLGGAIHHRTGLIGYQSVSVSAQAVREKTRELFEEGVSIAIADTLCNDDLKRLASALHDAPLVTAGSGLGSYLAAEWGFEASDQATDLPPAKGFKAILSGSCSSATRAQIYRFVQDGGAAHQSACANLAQDLEAEVRKVSAWANSCWERDPEQAVLVYSTAEPGEVQAAQVQFGLERSAKLFEAALSATARAFVRSGAAKLVVAGGETSGVCVRALGSEYLQIGPQIDPGVAWCYTPLAWTPLGGVHIALKSGNFGSADFFQRAFTLLDEKQ